MTNLREAAQMALDALEYCVPSGYGPIELYDDAIEALRAALAQPEPVIQARKVGDLIVVDLPQVPTGSGGVSKNEQPESNPVAYIDVETRNLSWAKPTRWETPTVVKMDKVPLYTTPPKKEWQELTYEETNEIAREWQETPDGLGDLCRAIETKLKEKNT